MRELSGPQKTGYEKTFGHFLNFLYKIESLFLKYAALGHEVEVRGLPSQVLGGGLTFLPASP